MTKARLEQIKESVTGYSEQADRIMTGDYDNYDGADGVRTVRELCKYFFEVIDALEKSGAIQTEEKV